MIREVENAVHDIRCMDNYSTCCCISAGFDRGSSHVIQMCRYYSNLLFQDVFSLVKHIRGFLGDAKGGTNWEGVMASQGLCLQMASPTTTLRGST